ncbi:hypothetical protein FHL15_005330 [Xylaria flabelliformis]|uniref:Rhodopsin domain-containing protein n=1 Tax=Xylaria flabelliformis TaxID=2512241 RepID=A0A553I0C5_9PEZI|nr:hypothetical protein FHL15_005330 [Xylaria flabelliformis]
MAQEFSSGQQEALLNGPALAPPPGHIPNFANPPNLSVLTHVVVGLAFGTCSILILGRICVTLECQKTLYLADTILLFGFATFIAHGALIIDSTSHVGYLIHQWDNFAINYNLFAISSATIKAAIILEWLRIFNPPHKRGNFFWASHSILWTTLLFHLATLISFNAACRPYVRTWDPFVHGTCYDSRPVYVASTASYLIVDVFILLLPQRIIWRLHMTRKKKQGVAAFFGIGILAIISVIVRLVLSVRLYATADEIYTLSSLALLSIVEIACGIIVYCVPSAPKALALFKAKVDRVKGVGNCNERGSASSWPTSNDRIYSSGQGYDDEEQLALAPVGGEIVRNCNFGSASTTRGQEQYVFDIRAILAALDDENYIKE